LVLLTLNLLTPEHLNPKSLNLGTQNLKPYTLNLIPYTPSPQPLNPEPLNLHQCFFPELPGIDHAGIAFQVDIVEKAVGFSEVNGQCFAAARHQIDG